jgi:hypothetical protein
VKCLLAILCVGLATIGFCRIVPFKDLLDGVLDAELVVIVQLSLLKTPFLNAGAQQSPIFSKIPH